MQDLKIRIDEKNQIHLSEEEMQRFYNEWVKIGFSRSPFDKSEIPIDGPVLCYFTPEGELNDFVFTNSFLSYDDSFNPAPAIKSFVDNHKGLVPVFAYCDGKILKSCSLDEIAVYYAIFSVGENTGIQQSFW